MNTVYFIVVVYIVIAVHQWQYKLLVCTAYVFHREQEVLEDRRAELIYHLTCADRKPLIYFNIKVISPKQYRHRFLEAVDRSILTVLDHWEEHAQS